MTFSRLDEAGFDTKVTHLKKMKTRDSALLSPWFRSGCPDGRSSHTGLTSPGAVSRTWRGRRRAQHGRAGRRHDCREQLEAAADTPLRHSCCSCKGAESGQKLSTLDKGLARGCWLLKAILRASVLNLWVVTPTGVAYQIFTL